MKVTKPIIILGAGLSGCVIAYELAKRKKKVMLIEKESCVGGLTRSFRYGGFTFDIGPHRFYSDKNDISMFVRNILGDDFDIISRSSGVYFLEKYHTWPLRPKVIFNLPLNILVKSGYELSFGHFKKKKWEGNFKDYILENYGPTLYNIFFKDYTRKFLGLSPQEIHSDWAKEAMQRTIIDERMGVRNLRDILKLTFMFQPLRTDFIYPSGGIDLLCARLAEKIKEAGGEIRVNTPIDKITCSSGKIEEIFFDGTVVQPERLIWTGDLNRLCQLLNLSSAGLNYLSLLVYNIEVNKPINKSYQWCYYGSPDIVFNRVTLPARFSKSMVPDGKDSLCVEITCREDDVSWQNQGSFIQRIKDDLARVNLIQSPEEIDNIHAEKISNAYPIYTLDYLRCLEQVKEHLAEIKNLSLAGRTGLFWYNNMDDSIENGLKVAGGII